MRRGRRLFPSGAVAVLLSCLAHPVPAQSSDDRVALQRFAAELTTQSDSAQLRRLEQRYASPGPSDESEALRRLYRGFVRLRLGQVADGWNFRRAVADFSRATELEPTWGLAWHARGLAHRAEGEWQAANRLNLGKRVGLGSMEDAVQSFSRAALTDPTNAATGLALFQSAVLLRDTAQFATVTLPTLRQMRSGGGSDTGTLLALSRAERLMGEPLAAVEAARSYLAAGGTRGVGLRELAWNAFLAGEPRGDAAYYEGALEDDSASVGAYREDIALIAEPDVMSSFDRARGPARAVLLGSFWAGRDRASLRARGERLREHYRRLTYAERHFGLEVNRRHFATAWTDMYRSGSTRFDDRGIIYIRHGAPDQRAATVTFDIMPNETWRYHRADGDLLLHFAANSGGDIRDYRLVPSVTSIEGVGPRDAGKAATWFAFEDRCPLYPPFCKVLGWGAYGRARVLAEERTLVGNSVRVAVSGDGFEHRFARGLLTEATAFAVGRAEGGQLVHIVYQVTLEAPDGAGEGVAFRVPLRIRASFSDGEGRSAWVDTTSRLLLPGQETDGQAIEAVGRVTVVLPDGQWRYRMAVTESDSVGRVLPTDSLRVVPFDGSRLAVSDLVLSRDRRGAPWVPAQGDTAWFNPRRSWRRSDTLSLYHEIYGLPDGAPYGARLVVRKGRTVALTLKWEGASAGAVTGVGRTVSFATVRPGEYQIELEVTDHAGRKATAARRVRITD